MTDSAAKKPVELDSKPLEPMEWWNTGSKKAADATFLIS